MIIFFLLIIFTGVITAEETSTRPSSTPERFVLITMLYNETDEKRVQEYITCLDRNRAHPLIRKIHIIYDISQDEKKSPMLIHNYIKKHKLPVEYIVGRATYGYCFDLAAEKYHGKKIILCNGDIFFNDTLSLLGRYDFTNLFIALTRWNVSKNEDLHLEFSGKRPNILSQDAWIFRSPLPRLRDDDIFMGTFFCDSHIAYQAYRAGLTIMNPCLSVQCCHLHRSHVRHYPDSIKNDRKKLGIPWIHLPPSLPLNCCVDLEMFAMLEGEPDIKRNYLGYFFE